MAVLNKAALMAIVQPLTGLTAASVVWEYDPRPFVSDVDRAIVTLRLKSGDYLGGADDRRRTYTAGVQQNQSDATYTYEVTGPRTLVLEVKCECYDKSVEAYEILELVRSALNANFELAALNLSYAECNMVTDLPTTYDNRVVNVAILEITLNAIVDVTVSTQIGQGWIDTVDNPDGPVGSSKVTGTLS